MVDEILRDWPSVTGTKLIPKHHMLRHVGEFAKRWGQVSKFGEAHIESYHAQFRRVEQLHHINKGANVEARLRASLADMALRAVAPFLDK